MSRVRKTKESMSRELETTGLGEGQEASYWHVSEESSSSLHEVARRRSWQSAGLPLLQGKACRTLVPLGVGLQEQG